MKVITICGSMRYKKEMIKVTEELALKGYCILAPIYQVTANIKINEKQKELLKKNRNIRCDISIKYRQLYRRKYKIRNRLCQKTK